MSTNLLTIGLIVLAVLAIICIVRWYMENCNRKNGEKHSHEHIHDEGYHEKSDVYHYPRKKFKKEQTPQAVYTPNISSSVQTKPKQVVRQPKTVPTQPTIRPRVESKIDPEFKVQARTPPPAPRTAPRTVVNSFQDAEVVEVTSSLDLFSPKEDILAELGMTQEELDAELEKYKAEHEYKERRLPVNKNFNMEDYNASRKVLREAPLNDMASMSGSKRDHLQRDLLKKQALATLRKRDTSYGISTTFAEKSHNDPMPARRGDLGTVVHA